MVSKSTAFLFGLSEIVSFATFYHQSLLKNDRCLYLFRLRGTLQSFFKCTYFLMLWDHPSLLCSINLLNITCVQRDCASEHILFVCLFCLGIIMEPRGNVVLNSRRLHEYIVFSALLMQSGISTGLFLSITHQSYVRLHFVTLNYVMMMV